YHLYVAEAIRKEAVLSQRSVIVEDRAVRPVRAGSQDLLGGEDGVRWIANVKEIGHHRAVAGSLANTEQKVVRDGFQMVGDAFNLQGPQLHRLGWVFQVKANQRINL